MEEIINSIQSLEIEEPSTILISLVDKDFYQMSMKYINNEIFSIIETDPIHDHYIDKENSKILFNYLTKDNFGYNIFKNKVEKLIKMYKLNILINDNDIKTYVDYYLENLLIISNT